MTHAEVILWIRLKGSSLGFKFRRQTSVGVFVVDFYCPTAKLVIELDGPIHDFEKAQIYDVHRQKMLEQTGLKVIRFTNEEVFANLEAVLREIRSHLLLSEEENIRGGGNSHHPVRHRRPPLLGEEGIKP